MIFFLLPERQSLVSLFLETSIPTPYLQYLSLKLSKKLMPLRILWKDILHCSQSGNAKERKGLGVKPHKSNFKGGSPYLLEPHTRESDNKISVSMSSLHHQGSIPIVLAFSMFRTYTLNRHLTPKATPVNTWYKGSDY